MVKKSSDARVITRLDEEEQEILRRARMITGKNTSGVIKAALRAYSQTLPPGTPLEIFERHGVIGAVTGRDDLSESYKEEVDYSDKHDRDS